jgi:hypothetical protein
MKATINRLVYDTNTAEELANESYGYQTDFNHWSETLYKTKKGNYFLFGEGGALSKYAEPCGNNCYGGGDRIIPLTEEEALEWCELHGWQIIIDKHFKHLIEEA